MAARSVAALLAVLGPLPGLAQRGQPQKMEAPKWLDDEGKELFYDLEGEDLANAFSVDACTTRKKLLGKMMGRGSDQEAGQHRARVLFGLGMCELKAGIYGKAKQRFESSISELGAPNEEVLLARPESAHFVLIKDATGFLSKNELTQAGTALRRCREVLNRALAKVMKAIHKQMGQQGGQAPPLQALIDEIPGYGKSGQYLPTIVQQVPPLKQELPFAELVDATLDALDTRLATIDTTMKSKKLRLLSKGKTGSLLYVRGLPTMTATLPAENLAAAQALLTDGAAKAFVEEAAGIEKSTTLLKRTVEEKGCKGKGLDSTCEAVKNIADISSNAFGDTRVVVVKAGKKSSLDVCTTNANVGILVASKDGASLTVAGAKGGPTELKAGEPVVFDFCREASIEASSPVSVLFAQAWHPEFAAVERTTELRARAKSFGLGEGAVKAAAKVVNDAAKKGWEKGSALWRKSEAHIALKAAFDDQEAAKMKADEEANDKKRKEDEANDEERKKNLAALEEKRAAKRKLQQDAEAKTKARKKQLEEERMQRDPWLNDPSVVEVEKELEELKEQRRDANAKLEFDLSTQLTKDISAAERKLKKTIKAAKKAFKKGGKVSEKKAEKKDDAKPGESAELKELKDKLQDIVKRKKEASEAENFKEAKKLKKDQKDVEEKIQKLEL